MVSIIVPVYNTEKYISETISSVINQTYQNWELIMVDDGSTDNSAQLIKDFCKKHNNIEYFFQKNSGVSAARNLGLQKAKGEYIFFLDADDFWRKDNLSSKVNLFENDKSIYWIYGSLELISENSHKLNEQITGDDSDILSSLLSWDGNVITAPSTIAIKAECLGSVSFDENFSTAADQDFAIQLANKYKGKYFDNPTVLYRVLPNSMSRNIELMEKDHILVYRKAESNQLFKNFWFKQFCFSNLYWILAGSWWKNGKNKLMGFRFIILALITNPFSVIKLIKKLVK